MLLALTKEECEQVLIRDFDAVGAFIDDALGTPLYDARHESVGWAGYYIAGA